MRWITEVPATGSTNADMLALAGQGFAEGQWLRAESQLAGRGRQGRAWASPAGNLYATTLIRTQPHDPPAHTLGLLAGVALFDAVRAHATDVPLALKWPNDLMSGAAKLAGILLERQGEWVAAGFGVNLASAPDLPDRATASLAALGHALAPQQLCQALADEFALWLGRWRTYGLMPVITAWRERALAAGTAISVTQSDGVALTGTFAGLADDGALRLAAADGTIRTIYAADVAMIADEKGMRDAARD